MKNFNNKGFALVETLVVTTFVMVIFSIIYTNFYPLIGEYERRETYDDLDGKYAAYWFKRIIQKDSIDFGEDIERTIDHDEIYSFSCNDLQEQENKNMCMNLMNKFNVSKIILTSYDLLSLKNNLTDNYIINQLSSGLIDYVEYLPDYTEESSNKANYRLLIEFHRTKDDNDYYAYSTIEVKK